MESKYKDPEEEKYVVAEMTPMMQQYLVTKKEYPDCILFYRLGDFYEMFFEDALTVTRELEITLTGKNCGLDEKAPMCGVPYHAVDGYLNRLIQKGYKVAICEQVEDPKLAKGLVKREVVRVVTPGTNINEDALDASKNNYILCVVYSGDSYGLSIADVTTGDFYVTNATDVTNLLDEIYQYAPSEIICNDAFFMSNVDITALKDRLSLSVYSIPMDSFDEYACQTSLCKQFGVSSLEALSLSKSDNRYIAAGGLLNYLLETQKTTLTHITKLQCYVDGNFMLLDHSSRRNLELSETIIDKQKKGSLLWVLDKTKTAMGARLLRQYIEQPLISKKIILRRLDAVEAFIDEAIVREEIREYLGPVYDLERLMSRITYQSANPRDLKSFHQSLSMLPHIKTILKDVSTPLLKELYRDLDPLTDIAALLEASIIEEPPLAMKDGGIIKEGYNEEVDRLRKAKSEGKTWLADLEAKEREATGIKSMRIRYNKVFGYYLEVTNSFKDQVPAHYTRKQTLANAERYIIPELKELEDDILGAEDQLTVLEYDLYCEIRNQVSLQVNRVLQTAKCIANIDVLCSLAFVAEKQNYVKPELNEKGVIDIKDGRHPVVEKMIPHDLFIPNDTYLDDKKKRISVITGPNMAGKSTYMRQTALIVLMAQIGSFVPASSANIGIVDRIFTRVGASDDLASGQSTFMVEMTEVANILRNATKKSLLILDEIGRGTSTFDGLSIAWAVIEHISDQKLLGAKTLFATHYHELTELEGKIENVNNYCIAVKENDEDIVFLRKIVRGGADKSYGIQVAKLAGVPDSVIERAKIIVQELSNADITSKIKEIHVPGSKKNMSEKVEQPYQGQLSIFDFPVEDEIIKRVRELNVESLTPLEALQVIYELQNEIRNR